MKAFTVMLEEEDVDRLRKLALSIKLPPHVLARSILLRGLDEENEKWLTGGQSQ